MKNWRRNLIFILITLFGAAIIGRLLHLQIVRHDFYKALAQGQQTVFQSLRGERGKIFFRGGEVLASNIKSKYLFVSPKEIEDKEKTARSLSEILGLKEELILAKLRKGGFFEQIKNEITKEEEDLLKRVNLQGVYLGEASFRKYPQGRMASQTVGFLGGEGRGQYGIEGYYDKWLRGKEYLQEGEGAFGRYFLLGINEEAIRGADLFLTLDYNIQFMAEKLLKKASGNLNIEAGQIIVLEPSSGKILALANYPNFDPNRYFEVEDFDIFKNSAIQKLFEPGSVFKPITIAGALEEGKITPQTTYIDEGKLKIGGYVIYNYGGRRYGKQTMTEVLEKSINTGAVFAERQLGHNQFLKYIEKFGFFEPTGIDLQEEVFSENREFKKGYEINFATASFGQGIEVTPIQLARAFSVIANGGKMIKPYLVEKISENGKINEIQPASKNRVITQKTAAQLTAMLVSVVENGFGKGARIPGYYIAGKTGTAQIPWSALGIDKKGYSEKTWQSFIGFAPAFNPKFLILIKLDNPKTKTAEYSAVPLFQKLAKYIIDYLAIPPDYEPS